MNPAVGIQGGEQKTSTEGELGGAGGGTTPGATVKPAEATQTQGDRQALQKGAGKTKNPGLLNRAQGSLTAADRAVQDEANAYVNTAKAKDYSVKDADIDSYVSGDQRGEAVTGLLNKSAADRAEGFKSKQDLQFNDVDQLQSDEGIKQALRNEGGSSYTAGMGAFDLAALRRTPGFDQIRANLAQQKKALVDKAGGYETSKTAEAQGAYDTNLKTAQDAARTGLSSRADALTAANQAEAQAANATRRAGLPDFLKAQSKSALDEMATGVDPSARLAPYLTDTGVDASKYYGDNDLTGADVTDQGEADRFNRIMTALGRGPESNVQAGAGLRDQTQDFDRTRFQNDVYDEARGKRKARDTDLDAQIEAIRGGIEGRITPEGERENEQTWIDSHVAPDYQDVWGTDNGVDAGQYMTGSQDWHNYINQGDLDRLNPLYQERGEINPYVTGDIGKGAFDSEAYKAALTEALSGKRQRNLEAAAVAKLADAGADMQNDIGHEPPQKVGIEDENGRPTTHTSNDMLGGVGGLLGRASKYGNQRVGKQMDIASEFLGRPAEKAGLPVPVFQSPTQLIPKMPTVNGVKNDFEKIGGALKKTRFL